MQVPGLSSGRTKEDLENYLPVALIPRKAMEQIILGMIAKYKEDERVTGAVSMDLCLTNLVASFSELMAQ